MHKKDEKRSIKRLLKNIFNNSDAHLRNLMHKFVLVSNCAPQKIVFLCNLSAHVSIWIWFASGKLCALGNSIFKILLRRTTDGRRTDRLSPGGACFKLPVPCAISNSIGLGRIRMRKRKMSLINVFSFP